MAKKAAKAKSRAKSKKARSKAKVAAKKTVAKKAAARKKTAPKKPLARKKKAAKKAPVRKVAGGAVLETTLASRPTKDETVVGCVIAVLNTNNPGWNADLKGEDRTLADLRFPAGLFLSEVNKCLKPKGFRIVVTNALQGVLDTGTIADIEIELQDATQPLAAGRGALLEATLDLELPAKTNDEIVVDCVKAFIKENNEGENDDLQGEDKKLADLNVSAGTFLKAIRDCLKAKGLKIVVTSALQGALDDGKISDIEIELQDAVKPL